MTNYQDLNGFPKWSNYVSITLNLSLSKKNVLCLIAIVPMQNKWSFAIKVFWNGWSIRFIIFNAKKNIKIDKFDKLQVYILWAETSTIGKKYYFKCPSYVK